MKKILLFVVVIAFSLYGCQTEQPNEYVAETETIDLSQYPYLGVSAEACLPDLLELHAMAQDPTRAVSDQELIEKYEVIKVQMLPSATLLMDDLAFTVHDLNEIFETNYTRLEDMDSEVAAFSLFLYYLQQNIELIPGATRASLGECFLEASGIAAGMDIIGRYAGQTIGKAAIKAIAKVAFKAVGRQLLGGIGLVLFAAEVAWCMYR